MAIPIPWSGSLLRAAEVFLASALPFIENKGAILFAAAIKLKWYIAYFLSVAGSYIPVPFLLRMRLPKKTPKTAMAAMAFTRTEHIRSKYRPVFQKYGSLGLFFLISIPFTGFGSWLGALIANAAGFNRKRSAIAIFLGLTVSSLITTAAAYGIVTGISLLF